MTDKEKIKAELERLRNEAQKYESMFNDSSKGAWMQQRGVCERLLSFINSLQEEPVSEDLEKVSKEWLTPQLDNSYAVYGEAKMMELTKFDGYAMLDAIEFGAKWQFERVNEALLSEVLPCFMHGGEADEVVAKLEEVLNQKK